METLYDGMLPHISYPQAFKTIIQFSNKVVHIMMNKWSSYTQNAEAEKGFSLINVICIKLRNSLIDNVRFNDNK